MYDFNRFKEVLLVIIIAVLAYSILCSTPMKDFDCDSTVCHIYQKKGLLGSEKIIEQFNQADVVSYSISKYSIKHRKNDWIHDEYYPILVLKDGRSIAIPRGFCRIEQHASDLATGIMQGRTYSKKHK